MTAQRIQLATSCQAISAKLKSSGYAVIWHNQLEIADDLISDQNQLLLQWENLEKDLYLRNGDGFRYRRFRYCYFEPALKRIKAYAPTPYYQPAQINSYAGGIDRHFGIMSIDEIRNLYLAALIQFDFDQLPVSVSQRQDTWLVDIHQIRVVTSAMEQGEPTPEGIHHDENDFGWIHLIGRSNIIGGSTSIYDNERHLLESFILSETMDSAVLCDPNVMHSVSAIHPDDPAQMAYRDVLLIGFTHCSDIPFPTGNTEKDYNEIKNVIESPDRQPISKNWL